jgi:uncharacterized iron-regulated membrane protein
MEQPNDTLPVNCTHVQGRANIGAPFFFFAMLLLVESGYILWLQKLPTIKAAQPPVGFVVLPPWYGRPRLEIALLLTVVGGLLASSGLSLLFIIRQALTGHDSENHRAAAMKRLKNTAFFALLAGAEMLSMHLSVLL